MGKFKLPSTASQDPKRDKRIELSAKLEGINSETLVLRIHGEAPRDENETA